ncbi:MAG: ribonuclease III [Bdellovibrionales bacterium]
MDTGYTFRDASLKQAALTHPSASKRKDAARAYERLEFLGDRVLGLVMAEWLYELFPLEAEGELARRHAALVQRSALLAVAEKVGLEKVLKYSKGEGKGGRAEERGRATILADALEALLGAMFLDGGLKPAQKFIRAHFTTLVTEGDTARRDPKTALQEWAQGHRLPVPVYELVERSGPAHAPHFVVSVTVGKEKPVKAEGKSKQAAEKAAAALLLTRVSKP